MNKFNQLSVIKHINCLDVAFEIEVKTYTNNGYLLNGSWINISVPYNPYNICNDQIFVNSKQVDNWKVYNGKLP